jgi:hypothetical protein
MINHEKVFNHVINFLQLQNYRILDVDTNYICPIVAIDEEAEVVVFISLNVTEGTKFPPVNFIDSIQRAVYEQGFFDWINDHPDKDELVNDVQVRHDTIDLVVLPGETKAMMRHHVNDIRNVKPE